MRIKRFHKDQTEHSHGLADLGSTCPRLGGFWFERLLMLAACVAPAVVGAWGAAGHRYQARLLLDVLPADVQAFLGEGGNKESPLVEYAIYPDSTDPFDPVLVGESAAARLSDAGLRNRHDLHSNRIGGRGTAWAFILLVEAMRDRDAERAALWAGSLLHTVGDNYACNHSPLIHYMTYAFRPQGIEYGGKGIALDFGNMNTTEGRPHVEAALVGFKPTVLSLDADNVLTRLFPLHYQGAAFTTRRERMIAATHAETAGATDRAAGMQAMAELGVEGVKRTADLVVTAWALAQAGKQPTLTDAIVEQGNALAEVFWADKPLQDDSIFEGLLDGAGMAPAIGVLLEPTRKMNQGFFSGGSKFILASAMRSLANSGIPFAPVDVRSLVKSGLPNPSQMPVLVVCAGDFVIGAERIAQLNAYVEAGGRLLWIGGGHPREEPTVQCHGVLGPLSKALSTVDDPFLLISRRHADSAALSRVAVRFRECVIGGLGAGTHGFYRNPNTPAGWHKPFCNRQVDTRHPAILGLAELVVDEKPVCVAAALMEDDKRARHVFIPEYLLAPFLFVESGRMPDPSRPTLDAFGERVLLGALRMLAPGLVRADVRKGAVADVRRLL